MPFTCTAVRRRARSPQGELDELPTSRCRSTTSSPSAQVTLERLRQQHDADERPSAPKFVVDQTWRRCRPIVATGPRWHLRETLLDHAKRRLRPTPRRFVQTIVSGPDSRGDLWTRGHHVKVLPGLGSGRTPLSLQPDCCEWGRSRHRLPGRPRASRGSSRAEVLQAEFHRSPTLNDTRRRCTSAVPLHRRSRSSSGSRRSTFRSSARSRGQDAVAGAEESLAQIATDCASRTRVTSPAASSRRRGCPHRWRRLATEAQKAEPQEVVAVKRSVDSDSFARLLQRPSPMDADSSVGSRFSVH